MRTAAALLSCLLAACAGGGDAMQSTAERVDSMMAAYAGDVPGAALLVLHDGEPVLRKGYGLADVGQHVAVTPATNFRLASVSKQFTAASILLLAQDGALSLDDPLRKWLPSLPPATDGITLHHLLSHTSGLVDYEDVMPDHVEAQLHDADVLRLLEAQDRLYFAPGSDYRYSNSGYALLALIVGKASGRDFASFLRERIFAPLGMADTVAFEDGISTVRNRAYGHSEVDGKWTRTDQSSTSAVLGDGGIYSSIDDLAKWDAALYDDRLLSDASRRLAFIAHTATDEADVDGYGYGWRIHDSAHGRLLWHSGETIGFRNVILRWPEQRLTVVLLSNRNDPEPYKLAREIAALYL
ncbi:MAG TPA: serine hydrolase domain-containing protein [Luteimonas sp.]|nr:serine hydrolase domain-containing protein [Luteimonas sp.]HRO28229.1 serine hydrolase domain-containing protein [Luteimonas sp.]HRP71559.1 serine hydrolase domain-containing protein [Luteimonas sp.]